MPFRVKKSYIRSFEENIGPKAKRSYQKRNRLPNKASPTNLKTNGRIVGEKILCSGTAVKYLVSEFQMTTEN